MSRPEGLHFIIRGKTDIGLVREENQDSFSIREADESTLDRGHLLVLADGMGGLAHGGRASEIAVNTLRESYHAMEGDCARALEAAVQEANDRIYEEAQKLPGDRPMGSTLTALVLRQGSGLIAQVGDSRAYRIPEGGGLQQLTRDHTLVQELADRGEIEPDSLSYLLHRNVLTRGLGLQEDVEVDLHEVKEFGPGDTFLLCSDGLYDVVADGEIERQVLSHGRDIDELLECLVELARSRGAPDNVTVLVSRIESSDEARRAPGSGRSNEEEVGEGIRIRPGSLFTPVSYFVVFVLGVILTLLLLDDGEIESIPVKVHLESSIEQAPVPPGEGLEGAGREDSLPRSEDGPGEGTERG